MRSRAAALFGIALCACSGEEPTRDPSRGAVEPGVQSAGTSPAGAGSDVEARASEQLAGRPVARLDARNERVVFGARSPTIAESDAPPSYDALLFDARASRFTAIPIRARAVLLEEESLLVVGTDGVLSRFDGASTTPLTDRVAGAPARLPNGDLVVSRLGAEPGESDLHVLPVRGPMRALAPAPGPDDLPTALSDGRIAFVSGRTSVASLFVLHPDTGALTQLTNRGLIAGRPWRNFVPLPAETLGEREGQLEYLDGAGRTWRVDLATGTARSTSEAASQGTPLPGGAP